MFIMPTCPDIVIWNYDAEWTNANVKLNVDTVYRYIPLAWKKPMDNFYKLNINGTRSSLTCKIGAGGVIRDVTRSLVSKSIWELEKFLMLKLGVYSTVLNLLLCRKLNSPFIPLVLFSRAAQI
ncbi:hypothetical protein RchiOBHm_Chr5g0051041 [Rosa chinensis]|uniref:Uncharacterized protein n=1 Tax=Rosa chinensis TaxID=74649 RepID=A0A2P6QF94_ROSCH|nr:hypothetical protein RchiOBHm_Chr5g0051041 [Rosa chinensis]